jgi:hypothetical protein
MVAGAWTGTRIFEGGGGERDEIADRYESALTEMQFLR